MCTPVIEKDLDPLAIPLKPESFEKVRKVKVWRDEVEAWQMGDEYDQWFSKALGIACHLVYMPDISRRPIDPEFSKANEMVSFADGYPFLVVGEASLEDLNQRLEHPVGDRAFPPESGFFRR